MKKAFYTAVAAISLVTAPTMAAAAPVTTPLTQQASETVDGDSALAGLPGGGLIIAVFAAVFVGLGIYIAVDKNDKPNSP